MRRRVAEMNQRTSEKRQSISNTRTKINELKYGLEKFRVTHKPREAHKSSIAVTDADENMVRMPSTGDPQVKLNNKSVPVL